MLGPEGLHDLARWEVELEASYRMVVHTEDHLEFFVFYSTEEPMVYGVGACDLRPFGGETTLLEKKTSSVQAALEDLEGRWPALVRLVDATRELLR